MKKVLSIILVAAMVLSLAACGGKKPADETKAPESKEVSATKAEGESKEESGDPIHIALIGPQTGNNAYAGEAMFNGIKMAIDAYNKDGGYNGRMIKYDEYDTKADANEGTIIAQKLAADESVVATIGPLVSTVGLAMAPIIDKAGILMYAVSPSHADLTKSSEWVIRQSPIAATIAKGLAETLLDGGYKKGVFMYDNTNEGAVGGATLFEEFFKEGGGECSLEGYAAGTKDFTPMITKYKSEDIDFIAMYGATSDSALICTQTRDLDMDCMLEVNPMASNDEFNELISGLDNVYCCDTYADDYPSDELQAFVSEYEGLYGERPILHAYLGWCAADRFCKTIDELGPDDMDAVRAQLRNGEQETPLGTLTFVDGDADRPTVWSKYDKEAKVFKAVTEIPANN